MALRDELVVTARTVAPRMRRDLSGSVERLLVGGQEAQDEQEALRLIAAEAAADLVHELARTLGMAPGSQLETDYIDRLKALRGGR